MQYGTIVFFEKPISTSRVHGIPTGYLYAHWVIKNAYNILRRISKGNLLFDARNLRLTKLLQVRRVHCDYKLLWWT